MVKLSSKPKMVELTTVLGCSPTKVAGQRHEEVARTVGVAMHVAKVVEMGGFWPLVERLIEEDEVRPRGFWPD